MLTHFSTSRKLDYWTTHCYPADVASAAARIDDIILNQATAALGVGLASDALALQRLWLPVRPPRRGAAQPGGPLCTRSGQPLSWLCPRCWTALLDRTWASWTCHPSRPALAATPLAACALAAGANSCMQSGSRLGATLRSLWLQLQTGAGSPTEGILSLPAEEVWPPERAEDRRPNLLSTPTAALVAHRAAVISDAIEALPREARARQHWLNLGRESSIFLLALPRSWARCPDGEWVEIAARYFGLPSPACAQLALMGARIPGGSRGEGAVVDVHGDAITAPTAVKGDHVARQQHDPTPALLCRCTEYFGGAVRPHGGLGHARLGPRGLPCLRLLLRALPSRADL